MIGEWIKDAHLKKTEKASLAAMERSKSAPLEPNPPLHYSLGVGGKMPVQYSRQAHSWNRPRSTSKRDKEDPRLLATGSIGPGLSRGDVVKQYSAQKS